MTIISEKKRAERDLAKDLDVLADHIGRVAARMLEISDGDDNLAVHGNEMKGAAILARRWSIALAGRPGHD